MMGLYAQHMELIDSNSNDIDRPRYGLSRYWPRHVDPRPRSPPRTESVESIRDSVQQQFIAWPMSAQRSHKHSPIFGERLISFDAFFRSFDTPSTTKRYASVRKSIRQRRRAKHVPRKKPCEIEWVTKNKRAENNQNQSNLFEWPTCDSIRFVCTMQRQATAFAVNTPSLCLWLLCIFIVHRYVWHSRCFLFHLCRKPNSCAGTPCAPNHNTVCMEHVYLYSHADCCRLSTSMCPMKREKSYHCSGNWTPACIIIFIILCASCLRFYDIEFAQKKSSVLDATCWEKTRRTKSLSLS